MTLISKVRQLISLWHQENIILRQLNLFLQAFSFKDFMLILWVYVFCLHMCMHTTCVQYLRNPEEGIGSPSTGITDGCELPCKFWEPNLGSLSHSSSPHILFGLEVQLDYIKCRLSYLQWYNSHYYFLGDQSSWGLLEA